MGNIARGLRTRGGGLASKGNVRADVTDPSTQVAEAATSLQIQGQGYINHSG